MKLSNVFSSMLLVTIASLFFQADVTFSRQTDSPGAKIVGKRTADLPPGPKDEISHVPIDMGAIQEFQRLSGTCIDDEGLPVAGVSVELFGKSENMNGDVLTEVLIASMVTGDDGAFDFENLQERFQTDKLKRFFVMALRKKNFATVFSNPYLWETNRKEIKLKRRAMVKGVVRNELGEPVSDADISFYHSLRKVLPEVYSSRSDKEGRFQIDDFHTFNSVAYMHADGRKVGSRRIPLIVVHPDYGAVQLMIERTPNLFEITIRRGARFNGRIVNDMDEPVVGCKINLQSHNGEEYIWFETASDDEGKFQFVKLPDIRANLFFETEDLLGEAIEVSGKSGSENSLGDLKLSKPVIVRGVLIADETGERFRGEAGSIYTIGWHGPERPSSSAGISSTIVNEDGTFECRFLPGMNFPYVASGVLETISSSCPDGILVEPNSKIEIEFRVRHK